jgi:hypothetical protein
MHHGLEESLGGNARVRDDNHADRKKVRRTSADLIRRSHGKHNRATEQTLQLVRR